MVLIWFYAVGARSSYVVSDKADLSVILSAQDYSNQILQITLNDLADTYRSMSTHDRLAFVRPILCVYFSYIPHGNCLLKICEPYSIHLYQESRYMTVILLEDNILFSAWRMADLIDPAGPASQPSQRGISIGIIVGATEPTSPQAEFSLTNLVFFVMQKPSLIFLVSIKLGRCFMGLTNLIVADALLPTMLTFGRSDLMCTNNLH